MRLSGEGFFQELWALVDGHRRNGGIHRCRENRSPDSLPTLPPYTCLPLICQNVHQQTQRKQEVEFCGYSQCYVLQISLLSLWLVFFHFICIDFFLYVFQFNVIKLIFSFMVCAFISYLGNSFPTPIRGYKNTLLFSSKGVKMFSTLGLYHPQFCICMWKVTFLPKSMSSCCGIIYWFML